MERHPLPDPPCPPHATLMMIRHAALDDRGRLVGRSDLTLRVDQHAADGLRALIGPVDAIAVSPALRCRQTASALWPDRDAEQMPELWEQDFGAWEGAAPAHLPKLGELPLEEIATTAPPGGESFADACARMIPALERLAMRGGRIAVVAHPGTVRAAIARATGSPAAALAFRLAPLSLTRIHVGGGGWSIGAVNLRAGG